MGRIFRTDLVNLTINDSTHVSVQSGSVVTIGGQQYVLQGNLTIDTSVSGISGGLDIGSVQPLTLYYVHVVIVGGVLGAVASTSKAPVGFASYGYTKTGFVTQFDSAAAIIVNSTIWDSVAYTMVIGPTTSPPTPGTVIDNSARFRRQGETMEISFAFYMSTGGSAGSGVYTFPVPGNFLIDVNRVVIAGDANQSNVGTASGFTAGDGICSGYVSVLDTSNLVISLGKIPSVSFGPVGGGFLDLTNSVVTYNFVARVPIVGWSGNDF